MFSVKVTGQQLVIAGRYEGGFENSLAATQLFRDLLLGGSGRSGTAILLAV
jgi:hypothetical protein